MGRELVNDQVRDLRSLAGRGIVGVEEGHQHSWELEDNRLAEEGPGGRSWELQGIDCIDLAGLAEGHN